MKRFRVPALMEVLAKRLQSSVGGAVNLVRSWRLDIAALRTLLDSTARPQLSRQFGADGSVVLNRIWKRARERWPTLPRQSTFGGAIMCYR